MMDEKSLEILGFPEIRRRLGDYASFSLSRSLALELQPLTDYEEIAHRLKQSAEARQLLLINPGFSIGQVSDVRESTRMASLGKMLEPPVLIDIQRTLAAMRSMRHSILDSGSQMPLLKEIANALTEQPELESEISRCLSPDGDVLDRASGALESIRRQLVRTRHNLRERLEAFIRNPDNQKHIQEPIITEREGRYVIPVKTEAKKFLGGITHDVSNTGSTVFVEPMVTVELGNTIRELLSEEQREIERILLALSALVGGFEAEITESIINLAELDLIIAKARYARTMNACEPELAAAALPPAVILKDARHPLLGGKAVPLNLELGREFSTLVITGPNTGGKTVALKTIGLLALMTQAGIPIPASPDTRLPVFDNIFADIGDEQSIEHTLSTFSWHISNMVRILSRATKRSLTLLDELGSSTDPAEGSALARAILLHFHSARVLTVATTHYADLKVFAHATPGMQNASFEFDPATFAPTYRLALGIPGGSNALITAERLGMPHAIIQTARDMLPEGALALEAALADIMTERQQAQALHRQTETELKDASTLKARFENELAVLKEKERSILQDARDTVVREVAELQKQVRLAETELRKEKSREAVEAARKYLSEAQAHLNNEGWKPKIPAAESGRPLAVGDTVFLKDNNLKASVLSIIGKSGEVELLAGQIKMRVSLSSISRIAEGGAPARRYISGFAGTTQMLKTVSSSLDLRGKRAAEVEIALDSYLNDAALSNLGEVIIIHGLATGTVKQITRDLLAAHPLVKTFRSAGRNEGGEGATVVSF